MFLIKTTLKALCSAYVDIICVHDYDPKNIQIPQNEIQVLGVFMVNKTLKDKYFYL